MSPTRLFARSLTALALGAVVLLPALPASAAAAIDLGTARSFAVLAGSGITNTGNTTITGDVGTFPTTSMTGFETVTLAGVNHGGDAVTQDAKNALTAAYNQAFGSGPATAVATELGGRTLTPGVYHSNTLGITGALTLDTQGDPNAVFVFQTNSTLITAAASSVVVLGGSVACNVFWQVGSSATFGANSTLIGSVLADTSISAGNGATFQGRLLARGGAVTMQRNTINATVCAAGAPAGSTTTTSPPTTTTTALTPSAAATATTTAATPAAGATSTAAATTTAATTPTAAATPAGSTTETARQAAGPSGGTATGVGRPGLATTGPVGDLLPLAGTTAIALGWLLVRLSRPLPALLHAAPRRGRVDPEG